MKQQLADGGNKQLVAQLKAPRSPQQLQANLSTVVAQVETARVEGIAPNASKVRALSAAVADVVQRDPSMDQAWYAAGELISYRTLGASLPTKECVADTTVEHVPEIHLESATPYSNDTVTWHDCTIVLDENKMVQDYVSRIHVAGNIYVAFRNVHVIYKGGSIPIRDITFKNCSFEFQTPTPPPPRGQKLSIALLTSDKPSDIKVDLRG